MKNFVINNGQFTDAGNFSGYTAKGERVHFHKRQMEAIGYNAIADVTFPFFAIGEDKEIGQLDADGVPLVDDNGVAVVSTRLTACSAFKTRAELTQAHVDEAMVDVSIAMAIAKEAKSAGLSDAQIDALANASF